MAFTALLGTADARPANIILAYNGQPVTAFIPPDRWQPVTSQGVRVHGLRGWTQALCYEPPWDAALDPALTLFTGWDVTTQPWVRGTPPRKAQHDPSAYLGEFYLHPLPPTSAILLRMLQAGYRSFSTHV